MTDQEFKDFYFIYQPIIKVIPNGNAEVIYYEVLLRSRLEKDFPEISFQAAIASDGGNHQLLDRSRQMMLPLLDDPNHPPICFNLHHDQFSHASTWLFFEQMKPYRDKFIIEVAEIPPLLIAKPDSRATDLTSILSMIHSLGFQISMDDVSSGQNSLATVIENIAFISNIKFTMVHFQHVDFDIIVLFLHAWKRLAEIYGLHFIVEGIEDGATSETLVKMGIPLQQGYYWGKGKESTDEYGQ